ncbi:MAG: nucleotidyltransferase family protein, partial [Clostridiales bacterium]|nr:nucleotidyltransferase family protein [Clostridiales bacterium]
MKVTGIISEYNPFHNGHCHHIRLARQRTGADVIVVIMNGNFVQRGECAVADKYLRAKMALLGGADYVFELPVRYGLSSAADFAYGGVLALHSLGCVDALCFGCESPGENLQSMAEIFWNCQRKPEENQRVQAFLREGNSFPAARQRYLQEKTGWSEE